MQPKNIALSKNIWLGLSTICLAAFSIAQDYHVSGFAGISDTDVGIVLTGLATIINRIFDKGSRPLYIRKSRNIDKDLQRLLDDN